MKFMIIVRATQDTEAGVMPGEGLLATMQKYHEELLQAGILVDASGLKPSSKGWRVKYSGDQRSVVDGPFAETKELIAGYTICRSRTCSGATATASSKTRSATTGRSPRTSAT
jgi:hypothetical protein